MQTLRTFLALQKRVLSSATQALKPMSDNETKEMTGEGWERTMERWTRIREPSYTEAGGHGWV